MKKVLLVAALALGVSLMTSGKASAQFYSGEHAGGVVATGYLGDNPFMSYGTGYRATFPALFAKDGLASMDAAMLASNATAYGDSFAFGMSMPGASMGHDIKLNPGMKLGSSALLKEFALLDRRTAVDLGLEVASGSSKVWSPLSSVESASLKTDASLAEMSGL